MGAKEYMTMMSNYTECKYGSMKNQINMINDHGVLSRKTGKAVLNANDHKWQDNILGYGTCSAFCDPDNKLTQMIDCAQQNGNRFVRPTVECSCRARTEQAWQNADKHFVIEGAPVLTKDSFLVCQFGGIIRFCEPPQAGDAPQTRAEEMALKLKSAGESIDGAKKQLEEATNKITDNETAKWINNNLNQLGIEVKPGEVLAISETQKIEITECGKKLKSKKSVGISGYKTPTIGIDWKIGPIHTKAELNAKVATVTYDQVTRKIKPEMLKVGCSGEVSIQDEKLKAGISVDKDGAKGEVGKS